jgi:uncharacterized membrane protein (DUF373 family)
MTKPTSKYLDKFLHALHWAVLGIEILVSVALTALAAGALVSLGWDMWMMAASRTPLTHTEFTMIMGGVLQVFILVELFRIAIAYMTHENVIPTVLEAALVAVARQFVVFEGVGGSDYMFKAFGLAALLLAVAITWWILTRANACDMTVE